MLCGLLMAVSDVSYCLLYVADVPAVRPVNGCFSYSLLLVVSAKYVKQHEAVETASSRCM